jgi:hypothetical protein
MSSHVGRIVVFCRCTVAQLLKSLLIMARSIVMKNFTFAVFEFHWLNNKTKFIYVAIVATVLHMPDASFTVLLTVTFNHLPSSES